MYFIDLEKLKIIKEFHFQTYESEVELIPTDAAAKNAALLNEACNKFFIEKPVLAGNYILNIVASSVTEDDFLGFVNLAAAAFTKAILDNGGRPRERRLDVPEKLKVANINMSLLKRMINTKTKANVLNFTIHCNEFDYYLIDTKDFKEDTQNA